MRPAVNTLAGSLLAVAGTVLAVVCCAGLPLLVGALGSVALGSIVIGAPALAVALLIAMLLMRRRRRGCPSSVALRSEPRRF
ncbi:hypothetical protein BH24ACT24_BH24ACT24_03630 [soil metagenome]